MCNNARATCKPDHQSNAETWLRNIRANVFSALDAKRAITCDEICELPVAENTTVHQTLIAAIDAVDSTLEEWSGDQTFR